MLVDLDGRRGMVLGAGFVDALGAKIGARCTSITVDIVPGFLSPTELPSYDDLSQGSGRLVWVPDEE